MATFIHEREKLNRGDVVVVDCDHQCNIRLTDDPNFDVLNTGQPHRYYGGFYRILPARIVVPKSGYWNVVVDLGGTRDNANYKIHYERTEAQAQA
jgi:Domain of unknown function (DUF1883)